ncbi:NUDIX hydrolase [Actinoallomurus acaciae]|uniref:NUDIX hydrolase n=1 Tax=Actinoallomurus acaciae TaxID=502577 RepID=A0ABV5YFY0_9ACTN
MGRTEHVVTTALVVVPGPGETVTFVRRQHGPYAGFWLLPGGKVEFGEPVIEAARREAAEESGCVVDELVLTGAYEILGPGHHFLVWAYRSQNIARVPAGFRGHNVADVQQVSWSAQDPHPTDMPILNDAGAAAYGRELIEDRMAGEGIVMTNLLTDQAYGAPGARLTGRT